MSKANNYAELLTKLKSKLDKGEMSTLVGAGFSKNIDATFPDWFELIHEMTLFTEGRRIRQEIAGRNPSLDIESEEYKKLLEDEIWNFNKSIGPLKAVTRYIQAKGFRESVDHMVELHTPVIEVIDGQRHLCRTVEGNVEKRLLTDADISSHEKLVNLPWTNIFTTNYDNLLEKCIDLNKKEEIENRIAKLNANISQRKDAVEPLKIRLFEKNTERDQKLMELEKIKEESAKNPQTPAPDAVDEMFLLDEIKALNGEISKLTGNISYEEVFVKRHESQVKDLNDLRQVFRTTVLSSSELAIKKDQNIIKIHGSICTDEPKTFGFDGDVSKNFVIAQEDYDSYPQKHEAFMQLMRISLLRESFCLFGFSGIDPNFLGWIAWVRDIIQKNPAKTGDSDKIFMIDVGEKAAEADKALFYQNHQIAFIPLGHPDCISFLEKATGKAVEDSSPKSRINLLLDFLSTDRIPSDYKIAYEVLKQTDYQNLWNNTPFSVDGAEKLKRFTKLANEIVQLKQYNRIPSLLGIDDTDHEQQGALEKFLTVYEDLKNDPEQVKDLLKVTLIMLQEVYLPQSLIFLHEESAFAKILQVAQEQGYLMEQFLIIELKDAVWRNDMGRVAEVSGLLVKSQDNEIQQEFYHQKALHAFYNFQFEQLNKILSSWTPTGHWSLKKAGLQSQLSLTSAIRTLEDSRLQFAQENVFKFHILSFLHAARDFRENGEDQYKVVRAIEKGNIKTTLHTVNRLIRNLQKKPEKLLPYGEGKLNITNTVTFSKQSKQRISLQLLQLWQESGHPLHLTHINYLPVADVYRPLTQAMLWFPEAVFYFTMQYSDTNFITRICQDLIYTETLKEHVLPITQNMMRAFFEEQTPVVYQKKLLTAISELINVIDPAQWQGFFLSVWESEVQKGMLTWDHRVHKQEFLVKGISLLTNPAIAEKVVHQLLEAFVNTQEQQVRDNVIQLLYQFRNNSYMNAQIKAQGLNVNPELFGELITKLKEDVFFLFVLGNISFSFNTDQQKAVKDTLTGMDVFKNKNPRLWRIILYFGDGDSKIEQKVKSEILESPAMWDSGIDLKTSTYTAHHNFITLSPLRRYKKGKSLQWTKEEVLQLYQRMVPELEKIYQWIKGFDHTGEFREIIKEMKLFLEAEEESLKDMEGLKDVQDKVMELYNLERSSKHNVEAILGDDKSAIIIEIENISEDIYRKDRLAESEFLIEALIYRLLLKKEPGLPAALSAVANWFFYLPGKDALKKYQWQLEVILRSYKDGREIELDEPSRQEFLIKLAIVLKRWNADEALTSPILVLLNTSRFNSIRNNLKTELLTDGPI